MALGVMGPGQPSEGFRANTPVILRPTQSLSLEAVFIQTWPLLTQLTGPICLHCSLEKGTPSPPK